MHLFCPDRSLDCRPYYIFTFLRGAVDTSPIVLSAIADKLKPQHRAGVFTLRLASVSSALIPGGLVGGVLSDKVAAGTCVRVMLFVGFISVFGIKGVLSGSKFRSKFKPRLWASSR
jgi:hypothetical protein